MFLLLVCLSVSRVTQKVVDQFRQNSLHGWNCVTSNNRLDFRGNPNHDEGQGIF